MLKLDGLAPIDGWVAAAILAKAIGYAAAFLAMGGPLFLLALPRANARTRLFVRRMTAAAAVAAAIVMALRLDIRAGRISGMGVEGMLDPIMIGIVWESPMGDSLLVRGFGLILALAVFVSRAWGLALALVGSVLIAVSYAQVGHALGEPRRALATLLTVHLLAAAYWIAALEPLRRGASLPGAAVLHRFGRIAAVTVGVLVIAGGTLAYLLVGDLEGLVGTAYGWTLLAKVSVVTFLLGLAALNKLRLVPAIARGDRDAPLRLRRSIAWEMAAVAAILLATATLTSITTPPSNL